VGYWNVLLQHTGDRPPEHRETPFIDDAALLLDKVGVAPEIKPNVGILTLDYALRPRDLAAQDRIVYRLQLRGRVPPLRYQIVDPVLYQQFVLKADKEARRTRVTLAPGAPTQLVIDPATLVTVGAKNIEATEDRYPFVVSALTSPQTDVGSPAGHVRRYRDGAKGASPGDDASFLIVSLGVEDTAVDPGRL
jgi:hypothetical protein